MSVFEQYLQEDNTIDVMPKQLADVDTYELFFGPTLQTAMPFITESKNIGEILNQLGLVQSKSWCKKNNWWRELEPGYQEIVFGSKRIKLCLLM